MWKIRDFVDLEYFFYVDKEKDQKAIAKRDRQIYLNHIPEKEDKSSQIKTWLEIRQEQNEEDLDELPGQIYENSYLLLNNILVFVGFLCGWGLTQSFLWYDGKTPINVSSFFFILIVLQILLLSFLIFVFLFQKKLRSLTLLSPVIKRILKKISVFILKNTYQRISKSKTKSFESKMGFLKAQKIIYGNLFKWQMFSAAQVFGIFFNLAVILTLLFKVFTADMALGWQSTAEVQTTVLHKTVEVIATPWSWFVEKHAYPSIEEIEGSKIVLKDGIYHLQSKHLASWWPFLCLSILFYGLFPRILLFVVGYLGQKRAIRKFHFNHAQCNRLLRRFETQYVALDQNAQPMDHSISDVAIQKLSSKTTSGSNYKTFIWESISELFNQEYLQELVKQKLTYQKDFFYIEASLDGEDKALLYIKNEEINGVVLLQPAWKPPVGEVTEFIVEIREILGQKEIVVALLGKPKSGLQENINANDYKMWCKAIDKLGDPYSSVMCLGDQHE